MSTTSGKRGHIIVWGCLQRKWSENDLIFLFFVTARHCSELFSILSQSPSWSEHSLPVQFHIVEALLGNPHKFHHPAPPPGQAIIILMHSFSLIHEKRHFNDKLSKCDEKMLDLCCVVESKIFAQGGYKSHCVGELGKRLSVCPFIPFKMHNQRIILNFKVFVFKRRANLPVGKEIFHNWKYRDYFHNSQLWLQ